MKKFSVSMFFRHNKQLTRGLYQYIQHRTLTRIADMTTPSPSSSSSSSSSRQDNRVVFFFDIDNCLYPKSKQIGHKMSELIDKFFMTHLSLSEKDANTLHTRYYRDYGLAIEGLVLHHKVDPLEYNTKVDDALPLEEILHPDTELRQLLEDIDRTKVKPWLFTNAYITHGKRVVQLLGIADQFEGITFCDYAQRKLICKPHKEMFAKAMREAGDVPPNMCYFVDDSSLNCKAAKQLGWTAAHLIEPDGTPLQAPVSQFQIQNLLELRTIFPHLFKSTSAQEYFKL